MGWSRCLRLRLSQVKYFRSGRYPFREIAPRISQNDWTKPASDGVCRVGENHYVCIHVPRHSEEVVTASLHGAVASLKTDRSDAGVQQLYLPVCAKMPRADCAVHGWNDRRPLFHPLPEQAAIVRFLDPAERRIRRYIRAKQKLITLLEEQKQAIIHQAVTGQIDVPNRPDLPCLQNLRRGVAG